MDPKLARAIAEIECVAEERRRIYEASRPKRLYLAGPINDCSDGQAHGWRETVMQALAGRYEFVNPMVRDYRGHEDQNVAAIVEGDLADIRSCHAMLAYVWKPSTGTAMEIRFASKELGIPVYAVSTHPVSPWLRYHATVYTAIGDAILELAQRVSPLGASVEPTA